jgi:hypothetical protein
MPMDYEQIAQLFGEAAPVEAQEANLPGDEPKPVEVKKDAPATVATAAALPKVKAKKPEKPSVRPDYMKSDDPDKDRALDQLWQLMVKDGVYDPTVIQAVVAEKDYYDVDVAIRDYDLDFIEGCLIEAWETVCGLALTKQNDLPF